MEASWTLDHEREGGLALELAREMGNGNTTDPWYVPGNQGCGDPEAQPIRPTIRLGAASAVVHITPMLAPDLQPCRLVLAPLTVPGHRAEA